MVNNSYQGLNPFPREAVSLAIIWILYLIFEK